MPYTQLFYHLTWSTKHRQCLLTPNVEPTIHDLLRVKAIGLEAIVFALNGVEDHVHMVVAIPAKIAVAKFIGQIKAVASTKFNQAYPDLPGFFWQAEYGAFTFDGKRLPNYIAYVERQKQHHAEQSTIPILERTLGETYNARESTSVYLTEDAEWRREMERIG
jgi:putative transposase